MPRVSKRKLSQKEINRFNQYLLNTLSSLTNTSTIDSFLSDFLTPEEKIMLSKRLLIFIMLKRNYNEAIIQEVLHVSYETIRIYKLHLRSKNAIFHKVINEIIRKDEIKDFFTRIDKFLAPLSLASDVKRNMRARAKFAQGDWTNK